MARIELSNIGGGGTTLSLTTTGTSGASTLAGSVLNIPVYQGQLTLTTTGTSGAATLVGNTLNIPQYSGGGGTPAGSTGEIQYNNAGAFAASANLAWDNTNVRLNIGVPSGPTGRLNVRGAGTTTTTNTRLTNSGNTELLKVLDNGNTNIGSAFNWDNTNGFLGINTATPAARINVDLGAEISAFIMSKSGISASNAYFRIANQTTLAGYFGPLFWYKSYGEVGYSGGFLGDTDVDSSTGTQSSTPIMAFFCRANNGTVTNRPLFDFANHTPSSTLTPQTSPRGTYMRIWPGANTEIAYQVGNTNSGYRLKVDSASATNGVNIVAPNSNSGTNAILIQSTTADLYKIEANGKISYLATNTAAGTTGAQTINRPSGTVNFAAGATALVVTNSLCTTASLVFAEVRTNDATAQIKNVVPAAGSFTINLSAAATAETSVGFFIIN